MFTDRPSWRLLTVWLAVAITGFILTIFTAPSTVTAVEKKDFRIFISCDGYTREFHTGPVSVEVALQRAGIELTADDIVQVVSLEGRGHIVEPEELVEVIRVTTKEIQQERDIIPGVQQRSAGAVGGTAGKAVDTVRVVYHNGVEIQRLLVKTEVLDAPEAPVELPAVPPLSSSNVSRGGGAPETYRQMFRMSATAYTHTGNNTATGVYPTIGTIAVDPNVIPLGSHVYVEGYGYGRAEDTGGAIKGNRIDVFMDTRAECLKWGKRTVMVYLLP